jgi:hypothetical protein
MKGKLIYYGIIVLGVGAISYMYYLSDLGGKKTFSEDLDNALKTNEIKLGR